MHIGFTFKNFEPSEHLRKYARRRMEKLGRFFGKNAALDAEVVMTVDKFRQRVEVRMAGEGLNISAEEQTEDMYSSIDLVLDKVGTQIKKYISRNREQWRKNRAAAAVDIVTVQTSDDEEPVGDTDEKAIVDRADAYFSPKPMSADEAAMQLDVREYDFLVFLNADNNRINVIYHRKNGDYGLIDPVM